MYKARRSSWQNKTIENIRDGRVNGEEKGAEVQAHVAQDTVTNITQWWHSAHFMRATGYLVECGELLQWLDLSGDLPSCR